MKFSTLASLATVAILASLAPATDGAFGAPANQNTSKPTTYTLKQNDAAAEKACLDLGGTITTAANGKKLCTLPPNTVLPQAFREPTNES